MLVGAAAGAALGPLSLSLVRVFSPQSSSKAASARTRYRQDAEAGKGAEGEGAGEEGDDDDGDVRRASEWPLRSHLHLLLFFQLIWFAVWRAEDMDIQCMYMYFTNESLSGTNQEGMCVRGNGDAIDLRLAWPVRRVRGPTYVRVYTHTDFFNEHTSSLAESLSEHKNFAWKLGLEQVTTQLEGFFVCLQNHLFFYYYIFISFRSFVLSARV